MRKRIAFAGCKTTTKECMKSILELGYKIDGLISLTPEQGEKFIVSGYMDLHEFAEANDIPIYYPNKYSLKDIEDEECIKKMGFDILLVIGWQRLIPEWFLNNLSIGAFGMHGSSQPLPKGRGRSPINWSLIEDKKQFITHLFKYNKDVDAGEIVGVQVFDINNYDTCETLHFKNRISMSRLLEKYLDELLNSSACLKEQPDEAPTYYPKRTPNDGIIKWGQYNTREIYNLVRAVTRPFPGAFSYIGDNKIYLWKIQPFDTKITYENNQVGEIVEVFYNNQFVVRTKDYSIIVLDYTIDNLYLIKKGNILSDFQ